MLGMLEESWVTHMPFVQDLAGFQEGMLQSFCCLQFSRSWVLWSTASGSVPTVALNSFPEEFQPGVVLSCLCRSNRYHVSDTTDVAFLIARLARDWAEIEPSLSVPFLVDICVSNPNP